LVQIHDQVVGILGAMSGDRFRLHRVTPPPGSGRGLNAAWRLLSQNQAFRSTSIDFLAQHFQSQPLLLGYGQFVPRDGERLRRSAKPSRIARIQVQVGQDSIQPSNLRL
jgi:hypothetical protein